MGWNQSAKRFLNRVKLSLVRKSRGPSSSIFLLISFLLLSLLVNEFISGGH